MTDLPVIQKNMIESFQCPGCVAGINTTSNCYEKDPHSFFCKKHVAGTSFGHIGLVNLGIPRPFNRLGTPKKREGSNNIRLYESFKDHPGYDHLNIPVWALETKQDDMDVLIVKCYCPRVNWDFVDVILNGKLDDVKNTHSDVYDVSEFIDSID